MYATGTKFVFNIIMFPTIVFYMSLCAMAAKAYELKVDNGPMRGGNFSFYIASIDEAGGFRCEIRSHADWQARWGAKPGVRRHWQYSPPSRKYSIDAFEYDYPGPSGGFEIGLHISVYGASSKSPDITLPMPGAYILTEVSPNVETTKKEAVEVNLMKEDLDGTRWLVNLPWSDLGLGASSWQPLCNNWKNIKTQ